jgi:hypothetical protein
MRGDGLPVVERIRRTLIALRMPRALELIDHAVQQLERGEASALELIDTLLAEELSMRESRRIKTGADDGPAVDDQDARQLRLLFPALARP